MKLKEAEVPSRYIFDIPIYFYRPDDYESQYKRGLQNLLQLIFNLSGGKTREQAKPEYESAEELYRKAHGRPWRFNFIIGWIRIYILGSQIRGEIWLVKAQRIQPNTRRPIKNDGKIFELHFSQNDSSATIFAELSEALARAQKSKELRKRYLDTETFENIGPYVEWKKLID